MLTIRSSLYSNIQFNIRIGSASATGNCYPGELNGVNDQVIFQYSCNSSYPWQDIYVMRGEYYQIPRYSPIYCKLFLHKCYDLNVYYVIFIHKSAFNDDFIFKFL